MSNLSFHYVKFGHFIGHNLFVNFGNYLKIFLPFQQSSNFFTVGFELKVQTSHGGICISWYSKGIKFQFFCFIIKRGNLNWMLQLHLFPKFVWKSSHSIGFWYAIFVTFKLRTGPVLKKSRLGPICLIFRWHQKIADHLASKFFFT